MDPVERPDRGEERPGVVVVLAYDGVAADEAAALVEILASAGLEVVIASVEAATVTSFHGRVGATKTVAELPPCRALIVPGGMGVKTAAENESLLDAIRLLAGSATWLGATSTGSVLLAAAHVVAGARATTHWLAGELITDRGLTLVDEPFVEHGRLLTATGLVSSATLAFRLVGALAGAEAEAATRARYRPTVDVDRRYRRERPPFWRMLRRKRVSSAGHPIDPTGVAEVVMLDLD